MGSKIKEYFKGEAGKATARSFGASVVAMYMWPLAAAITAGAVLQFALGVVGVFGIATASQNLDRRVEKKANLPARSLSSSSLTGWLVGLIPGLVLTSYFPIFTPAQKPVADLVPQTSVTEIAPSPQVDINQALAAHGLAVPLPLRTMPGQKNPAVPFRPHAVIP